MYQKDYVSLQSFLYYEKYVEVEFTRFFEISLMFFNCQQTQFIPNVSKNTTMDLFIFFAISKDNSIEI